MDLKQGPSDPYEGVKTGPDVSESTEENDLCSVKQEPFKSYHNVLGFGDTGNNSSKYEPTECFVNVSKIKKEIEECVVSKIECQPSDVPEKNDSDSIQFVKKELDNSETKQEVSESEYIQFKTERELLTTYCDLPTLKSESTEYFDDFVQPCGSSAGETLQITTNVISNEKTLSPDQKNFSSSKSRSTHIPEAKGFTQKPNSQQHVIIHDREKPFKCETCSKCFNHKSTLLSHLIIHSGEKPFKCETCSKCFKNKANFLGHLMIHTGEKPFKCETCSKCFNNKSNLLVHSLIHGAEKPVKCDICSKGFAHKSRLQTHLIIHSAEKPFKCNICSKGFPYKWSLDKHLIIHSGEKPYKCNICSKGFTQKVNLQQHLKIHRGEKPYKCNICFKSFAHLQKHLLIHSAEQPYKCNVCFKGFSFKQRLQKHLLIHSGEKP